MENLILRLIRRTYQQHFLFESHPDNLYSWKPEGQWSSTQPHWYLSHWEPRRYILKGFSSLELSFFLRLNPCEVMVATRSSNRQMLSLTPMLWKIKLMKTKVQKHYLCLLFNCLVLYLGFPLEHSKFKMSPNEATQPSQDSSQARDFWRLRVSF